jgi:hypothetical protein
MKKWMMSVKYFLLLLSTLVNYVKADDPLATFVGSPLLILVAFIVIDFIAFVFHKIRK